MTRWIGLVSCHLGSPRGAIELTVLCAFVCKVGYFDAQIKKILLYICSILWAIVISYLQGIISQNNSHSSSFHPLHLWKTLHQLQAIHFGFINLFSPFSIFYLKMIPISILLIKKGPFEGREKEYKPLDMKTAEQTWMFIIHCVRVDAKWSLDVKR